MPTARRWAPHLAYLTSLGCALRMGGSEAAEAEGPADGAGTLNIQIISSHSVNANARAEPLAVDPDVLALPAAQASVTGGVMGREVPAQDVVYEFSQDSANQNRMAMFIFFSEEADTCSRHRAEPVVGPAAGARALRLELLSGGGHDDQPFIGTYRIYNPMTESAQGRVNVAAATFVVADGRCGNQLAAEHAWATAGQVSITTHVTAAGAYLTGQLSRVAFGSQEDVLDGSFTALGCATNWAPVDMRQTCR